MEHSDYARHRRSLNLALASRNLEWEDFTFFFRFGFTLAALALADILWWLA